MNEVFVVMQGQYSDRHIEAIFDTEEMALAYTRAHRIPAWYSQHQIEKWQINADFFWYKPCKWFWQQVKICESLKIGTEQSLISSDNLNV